MSSSQVVAPSLKKVHLISKKFCHQVNEIFRPYKSSRSVNVSTRPYVDIPVFKQGELECALAVTSKQLD